ncbi:MAG TPA: PxKF domain-containing protein [Blastocatellia bacterium]|nr:PxKF domain-containing protein [Blastocatellia bacterium]
MKTSRISTPFLIAMVFVLGLGSLLVLATGLSGGSVSAAANTAPVTVNLPEPDSNRSATPVAKSDRRLTLKERVAYQRGIEAVYWRHRIWPAANSKPKPELEAVMPLAQIQAKVEDSLRKSRALDVYWRRPITAEQLQAEVDRIARQTQQPVMLAEILTALNNDPFLVAECLARPVLVERLIRERYAADGQSKGAVKTHVVSQTGKESFDAWWARVKGKLAATEPTARIDRQTTPSGIGVKRFAARSFVAKPINKSLSLLPGAVTATGYRLPAIYAPAPTINTTAGGAWSASNTWTAISTTNAPAIRANDNDSAVWTGAEMIVWGGLTFSDPFVVGGVLNTGGRYDPTTDSWTPTSLTNAPSARFANTAVWTGTEMIVWGGVDNSSALDTGARYNPTTNSWTATSLTNAPLARAIHTAVWTGSEMIIWGGIDIGGSSSANTGARYNPTSDSWTATSTTDAPSVRAGHTAVWTGSKMIIWGGLTTFGLGSVAGGGLYDPTADSWTATSLTDEPTARTGHTAVWTGSEMIIWGGFDLVSGSSPVDTGARYNPTSDSWTATSTTNAPSPRFIHTAVWTGSAMVVWGGSSFPGPDALDTGGSYSPSGDSWTATSTTNAPVGRGGHSAVWTGSKMLIWGGFGADFGVVHFDFTGFFPPVNNPPTLNQVNAGKAIPVKFSLNGDQGLDIFAAGFPVSQQITCDSSAPIGVIEETVTAGSSSLSYDPTTDQYTYVWKTNSAWAGTCRQLIVKLSDGSEHVANFKFK